MLKEKEIIDNRYEIMGQIGAGGGGIVYKAYDSRLNKEVVIKQIKENVKDKLNNRQEVDILKSIHHSYLPQVYDFIELNSEVYTIIDFIDGSSFADELENGQKFNQRQIIEWGKQLCEALLVLHNQKPQIIHSDIKPANIMHKLNGDVCLIDFNISLAFEKNSNNALGKSDGYSPPEQYGKIKYNKLNNETESKNKCYPLKTDILPQDDAATLNLNKKINIAEYKNYNCMNNNLIQRKVDVRSDIYSLGATLYHLLTGEQPNISLEKVKSLDEFQNIKCSEGLKLIIHKALAPNPKHRFQNVGQMLKAFNNIHKYDRRYKSFIFKRECLIILIMALFTVSTLSITSGQKLLSMEKLNNYNELIENSLKLKLEGNYTGALELIEESILVFPNNLNAHHVKFSVLYDNKNFEECINLIKDDFLPLLETGENFDGYTLNIHADILFILASCLFELENYNEAIQYYQKSISLNPNNGDYYRDLAISYVRLGELDKALDIINEADKYIDGDINLDFVNGEIYLESGDYLRAENCFLKLITKIPSSDETLKLKGYKLLTQVYEEAGSIIIGSIDKEIKLLESGLEEFKNINAITVYELLGDAYVRKAEQVNSDEYLLKAVKVFETLVNLGYDRQHIFQNIGLLYQQLQQYNQAETIFLEMAETYSNDYTVFKRLAFLEAEKQSSINRDSRNYSKFKHYYLNTMELYENESLINNDMEILVLKDLMIEVKDHGWLD